MRTQLLIAAVLLAWLAPRCAAGGKSAECACCPPPCPVCPPVRWCCDDYCRKPMPCIPPLCAKCCCDDYCRKPMPCIAPLCAKCCCDDYCRKPMPALCCPQLPPGDCCAKGDVACGKKVR